MSHLHWEDLYKVMQKLKTLTLTFLHQKQNLRRLWELVLFLASWIFKTTPKYRISPICLSWSVVQGQDVCVLLEFGHFNLKTSLFKKVKPEKCHCIQRLSLIFLSMWLICPHVYIKKNTDPHTLSQTTCNQAHSHSFSSTHTHTVLTSSLSTATHRPRSTTVNKYTSWHGLAGGLTSLTHTAYCTRSLFTSSHSLN